MSDLQALLARLADAGIEFVLVGGYAAVLHGSSMLTRDVDVCARLDAESVEALREALRDLHPVHRMARPPQSLLDEPPPGEGVRNLYLNTDLGTLDVLGSITGVGGFRRVVEGAIEIELSGRRMRVIGLGDLIAAKEALGREKDLIVAKELRALRERMEGP